MTRGGLVLGILACLVSVSPSPSPPGSICDDSCVHPTSGSYAGDGICSDGGPGAVFNDCAYGTDCTDCDPRDLSPPSQPPAPPSAPSVWHDDHCCTSPVITFADATTHRMLRFPHVHVVAIGLFVTQYSALFNDTMGDKFDYILASVEDDQFTSVRWCCKVVDGVFTPIMFDTRDRRDLEDSAFYQAPLVGPVAPAGLPHTFTITLDFVLTNCVAHPN